MSNRSVPLGWGARRNAQYDPEETTALPDRPADWSNWNLSQRYNEDTHNSDRDVPFGFGQRLNTKTIEELSMDRSATNVAVAEILLKDQPKSLLRPAEATDDALKRQKVVCVENTVATSSHSIVDKAMSGSQMQASLDNKEALLLLTNALDQMNKRMAQLESNVQLVLQQQSEILKQISKPI